MNAVKYLMVFLVLLFAASVSFAEEKCDFTSVEVTATTASGKTIVSTDFDRVKNECLIEFVLKSQNENYFSGKPIHEKVAYQLKLGQLLNDRGLGARYHADPAHSNLLWLELSAPAAPVDLPRWNGREWTYSEP